MEIHGFHIHLRVLDSFLFLILFDHGLDADCALVNTDDVFIALFDHLFRESGVSCSDVKDFALFIDIGGDDVLDSAESLIPIERLRVSKISLSLPGVSFIPIFTFSVLAHC